MRRKSGRRAAKKLKMPHPQSERVNRRLEGFYGLTRDDFIFAMTPALIAGGQGLRCVDR